MHWSKRIVPIATILYLTACIEAPKPPTWVEPTPSPSPTQSLVESTPTILSGTPSNQTPSAEPTSTESEPTATYTQGVTPTSTADPNVDMDGDGYTKNQGDCQPRDPKAYPGAVEQPYDGRDDNCNGVQDHVEVILGPGLNEGGDALFSRMDQNEEMAYGEDGTIYITDNTLCRIRAIKDGIIRTLVGNGKCEFSEDGISASEASIYRMDDIAIDDKNQRLYYAVKGEIWYLDLIENTVHYFIGDSEGQAPMDGSYHWESYFSAAAMAYEPFYDTLYFSTNGAIFTYQVYDNITERVYAEAGDAEIYGLPKEGPTNETNLGDIQDMQITSLGETIYFATHSGRLDEYQGHIASISRGELKFIAGGDDNCFYGEAYVTGDYDLPKYQELVVNMPAEEVILCNPEVVATHDEEVIYFFDEHNGYRYNTITQTVTRILQDGDAILGVSGTNYVALCEGYSEDCNIEMPRSGFVDSNGEHVYWAELGNQVIKKLNIQTGHISRVAGYGPGGFIQGDVDTALIGSPTSMALRLDERSGVEHLYITDLARSVIYEVANDEIAVISGVLGISEYAGSGIPALGASLDGPHYLEIMPDGALLFFGYDYRIQRISDGVLDTIAGTGEFGIEGDGGLPQEAQLAAPDSMAYVPKLNSLFMISSMSGYSVRRIIFDGKEPVSIDTMFSFPLTLEVLTTEGAESIEFDHPIEMTATEDYLYYSIYSPKSIVRFDGVKHEVLALEHEKELSIPAMTCSPASLAVDGNGIVYYTCGGNGIWRLDVSQAVKVMGSEGVDGFVESSHAAEQKPPYGEMLFSWDGDLIVANKSTRNVFRVSF